MNQTQKIVLDGIARQTKKSGNQELDRCLVINKYEKQPEFIKRFIEDGRL